jgi:hypothetical protein
MDPKLLHVQLQPCLEKNTGLFMKELWSLLHSASNNEAGVPQQLLDAKAEELRVKREAEAEIQVSGVRPAGRVGGFRRCGGPFVRRLGWVCGVRREGHLSQMQCSCGLSQAMDAPQSSAKREGGSASLAGR